MTRMYWMNRLNAIVLTSPGKPTELLYLDNPFQVDWTHNKYIKWPHLQEAVKNKRAILVCMWKN